MELNCICSLYEFFIKATNWKDYIIPFISPIIGVGGAYLVMYKQLKHQKDNDLEKRNSENKAILYSISITQGKLIKEIKETVDNLEKTKKELSLDKENNFTVFVSNTVFFDTITNQGFQRIFWLLKECKSANDDEIIKFWSSVSKTPSSLETIEKYINSHIEKFNQLNKEINSNLSSIVIECSKIIHSVFQPYVTYTLTQDQLKDPKIKLAVLLKEYYDQYKVDENHKKLRQNKNFLDSLNTLKSDPIASQEITSQLAQQIVDTLSIYISVSNLFDVLAGTISNYQDYFNKTIENIEKIKIPPEYLE